jgi:hypothetical protein
MHLFFELLIEPPQKHASSDRTINSRVTLKPAICRVTEIQLFNPKVESGSISGASHFATSGIAAVGSSHRLVLITLVEQ